MVTRTRYTIRAGATTRPLLFSPYSRAELMPQHSPAKSSFITTNRVIELPPIRSFVSHERFYLDPSTHHLAEANSVLLREWVRRIDKWKTVNVPPVEKEIIKLNATTTCCPSRRVCTGLGPLQDMAPSLLKRHPNFLKHQALTSSKRLTNTFALLDCGMMPHGINEHVPHWRLNRAARDLVSRPRIKQKKCSANKCQLILSNYT